MERQLNWGLLSTAKINHALIKPLNASKRTRLLAVASRSQSSADAYARENGKFRAPTAATKPCSPTPKST